MSLFGNQNNSGFGASTAASTGFGASSTGFGFGTSTTTTSQAAGGFGGGFSFGNPTTTASTGGFGGATSTGFGFGNPTTTASTGFGFGNPTTTASTGFGFGNPTTSASTGFGGFGAAAPTTSSGGMFGALSQPAASSTGFSFGTGTTGGLGGGFGTGTGGNTGVRGLGGGLGGGGLGGAGLGGAFGQTQAGGAGAAPQSGTEALTQMVAAVSGPMIFGDERDSVLAKWNQLQAFWGQGRGFYDQQGNAISFGPDNPFCRFKAVGYSCLPGARNSDGLVALVIKKPRAEVLGQQTQLVDGLANMLGAGQGNNRSVCVDSVRELADNCTELIIYVQERQHTGVTKRYSATEVGQFLNNNNNKALLGDTKVIPKTGISKDQLKQYLDNPPQGIDPLIWEQAKLDNPDPEKLLPVPIIGFDELYKRLKQQEMETHIHNASLTMITNDIASLQRKQSDMISKTEECKRKHLKLSHRVLQLIGAQEIHRKLGLGIDGDEEQLRAQLENIQVELNAPTQFKGRLNELMAQIRLRNPLGTARFNTASGYQIDPSLQSEIHVHLKQQQEGIQHLINIVKEDLEDLKLIQQGLSTSSSSGGRR